MSNDEGPELEVSRDGASGTKRRLAARKRRTIDQKAGRNAETKQIGIFLSIKLASCRCFPGSKCRNPIVRLDERQWKRRPSM